MQKPLVVVVPGIGGSVLRSSNGRVLWGGRSRQTGHLLRNPHRLDYDRPVRPVGLVNDRILFPGFAKIDGYRNLLDRLGRIVDGEVDHGDPDRPRLDARVVAFPYDFRRSAADSADRLDHLVRTRLDALGLTGRPDALVLVGYSTGGLVVRHWLARQHPPGCRALVTLGTPLLGSVKALDLLRNGAPWWSDGLAGLRAELWRWPSMHELLPRYAAIRAEDSSTTWRPAELFGCLVPAVRAADAVHEASRLRPEHTTLGYHAYLGRGHVTPLQASWDGTTLRTSPDPPGWLTRRLERTGDGSVPEYSAIPLDGEGAVPDLLAASHACMVAERRPLAVLARLVRGCRGAVAQTRPPMVGLDLADAYLAGSPVTLRARLDPPHAETPGLRLEYTLTGGRIRDRAGRLWPRGGAWHLTLPDLPPGRYDLTVYAAPQARHPGLRACEWFDVVGETRAIRSRLEEEASVC